MAKEIEARFRDRSDKSHVWAAKNPRLLEGERGFEVDTGKFKIGNGVQRWLELKYFLPEGGASSPLTVQQLNDHVEDTTPHPAYDDLPSLTLLFENGLI